MSERPYLTGVHHLKVPVSDLEASLRWWEQAFAAERQPKLDHAAPDDRVFGYILLVPGVQEPVELRLDPVAAKSVAGCDPVTFAVDTLAQLGRFETWCDQNGITHSPVLRGLVGWLLVLVTPDGLHVRIHTRESHEWDLAKADLHSPWVSPTLNPISDQEV
ncbi:MAG TPA: VOC family protein [Kribbella sp.]|uniref:VOC family protein n=1 Tax=Kribbella sp. TaxID=1871183 RepID=UPI002D7769CA|nr:VOC family protein [Kribbella sp.]HET6295636.1 VOC family protein [Kribbella sp.]